MRLSVHYSEPHPSPLPARQPLTYFAVHSVIDLVLPTSVDIIIVHRNTYEITAACIDSLLRCSIADHLRIVVVDNASDDDSVARLQSAFPSITMLRADVNLGYAKACNLGARNLASEVIVFSNSDVRYTSTSLEELVRVLITDDTVAVCGPQQFYPDGSWQQSHDLFPGIRLALRNLFGVTAWTRRRASRSTSLSSAVVGVQPQTVEYLDGAVLVVRRSLFDRIGGFDERYFFFCEDVELCHAFHEIGSKVLFVPAAHVIHERGFTRRRRLEDDMLYLGANERARAMFLRLHHRDIMARLTLIITTMYYAVISLVLTARMFVTHDLPREKLRHKRIVVRHLITICAEELERSS